MSQSSSQPPFLSPSQASPLPELPAGPVASPCISLCEMAPDTGLCRGCLRNIDEIVAWGTADDDFKRAVLTQIRCREQQMEWK